MAPCLHPGSQALRVSPAYLDDYAFLLDALLEALQSRFRLEDLRLACQVADALISKFADRERGGFWFTAEGEDPPLHRPKGFADEAMPSGNGIAAKALARLGWLSGEMRYLDAAEATIRGGYASLARSPEAHASMLIALDEYLDPVEILVLRGKEPELGTWQYSLAREYAPRRMVIAIPADTEGLPEALAGKRPRERTVAYVCRGPQCSEPVTSLDALVSAPHGLELRESRGFTRVAGQRVANLNPVGMLVVKDVALGLAVDCPLKCGSRDVYLAGTDRRGEKKRCAAFRAKAAAALLR